jgi:hypothetical protein
MKAVANVGANDQFAVTLDDAVPSVALGILRLLDSRTSNRSRLDSRSVNWNSACALTESQRSSADESQSSHLH